jgi:hypothetical protein
LFTLAKTTEEQEKKYSTFEKEGHDGIKYG